MINLMLFLREAIIHPSRMGALFPSSQKLARQLAQTVPTSTAGLVVELGAGTGAVTAELVKQLAPNNMLVIEQSARLASHLATRFPQIKIITGDACQLSQIVAHHTEPILAIVSGLPLRSLSKTIVESIREEINKVLSPGGLFIQFTYQLWGQTVSLSANLKLIKSQIVWRNLPPARIDVFQYDKQSYPR